MNVVWRLLHYKVDADQQGSHDHHPKGIGAYSTKENALAAIEKVKNQEGFRDWPGGFRISRVVMDQDQGVGPFTKPEDA